jgi:hypothetical protein
MQMLNGAWVCQAISTLTRLDVPERLAERGPLTAHELVRDHGVHADPAFLERTLESISVYAERSLGAVVIGAPRA